MPVRPVKDAIEQAWSVFLARTRQSFGERCRFLRGEVIEFNPLPDVERSDARVADQIARRRHAQEAKGQTLELRVFGAPGVTLADGREELVRREGQTANDIQFINEDDELV